MKRKRDMSGKLMRSKVRRPCEYEGDVSLKHDAFLQKKLAHVGVDGVDGGRREDPVESTKAECGSKGVDLGKPSLAEDSR